MRGLVSFVAAFFLTKILFPWGINKLKILGLTAKNYLGEDLPMPGGLLPITVFLVFLGLNSLLNSTETFLLLVIFAAMVFLGLFDDLKGKGGVKGFKGHFKSFLKGDITTGVIKAIGGFLLAFIGAWFFGEKEFFIISLIINSLLIALSTNLINLLDLRPGRATKIFLFFTFILIVLTKVENIYWLFPLIGAMLAYLPWDLKLKTMLGDAGANVLGFALGLSIVISMEINTKIVIVFFLIIIHLYTERISLSKVIEENHILKFLDYLGRVD